MANRNKSRHRFTSGGHDERPEDHKIELDCICAPMLDGGTMPRPKDLPLPLAIDPKCPIHGRQDV